MLVGQSARVFKSAWFAKAARKAGVGDSELCEAMAQTMLGHADDLGGGVYKKRLDKNRQRSIILAKGSRYWVFEFLYAKRDMANISFADLENFKKLATKYGTLTDENIEQLTLSRKFVEICNGRKT